MNEIIDRVAAALFAALVESDKIGVLDDEPSLEAIVPLDGKFDLWLLAHRAVAAMDELICALRQAQDALEQLRRGHGAEVSALCYPALNTIRAAVSAIDAALKE